jgi:hypothetical protein
LDGGFRSEPLRTNFSEAAEDLFTEIVQNENHALFGVLYYWNGDPADPETGVYRPSLGSTGLNRRRNKRLLESALEELVTIGWLEPADRVGNVDLYRMSDSTRQNELFIYNVNEMAKRREYR